MAWGLAATFVVVAIVFSYRYDTSVPGNWAARRLCDCVVLVPALLVPAVLQWITEPLAGRRRLAKPALALAVGALSVAATVDRVPHDRTPARAAAASRPSSAW